MTQNVYKLKHWSMHHIVYLMYIYEVYILELKFIQKVRIFVHFLYSTWVAWVRFAIYTFCIHLYTFCVHLWSIHFVVYIWNKSVYKKYTFLYMHFAIYTFIYFLCTLMKYKFCSIHLELLSTWHPLSNFDLLPQLVVTLVSQNMAIS